MRQVPRTVCYGLMRICGSLGFGIAATVTFAISKQVFHLDLSRSSFQDLSRREIVVAVVALFLGLLGTVIGQGFGASIPVKDDNRARNIDSFWHFGANSVIVWNGISFAVFGFAMGKEAATAFRTTHPFSEMIWLAMVLPVLLGWSIVAVLWFAVEVLPHFAGAASALVTTNACPFVLAFGFGAYEATELGLNFRWGAAMAIVPFFLIPLSLDYIRKDAQRRIAG